MRESIYHFKPVGHNTPDQKRNYPEPDPRLRKAFKEWFEEVEDINYFPPNLYNLALELIENLEPNISEAHSLLVAYQDHPKIYWAGYFLSAIYNRSPEKEIVFDLDLENPPHGLGYRLPKGKRLVNRGKAGDWMGEWASGVVLNCGEAGYGMGGGVSGIVLNYGKVGNGIGYGAPGVVINFGETGHDTGEGTSGLVINCGKANERMGEFAKGTILALKDPISFGDISKAKLVLRAEDCKKIPELGEYLENLRRTLEVGKKDYQAVLAWLEGLGEEPKERIESDIEKILRRAGYIQF